MKQGKLLILACAIMLFMTACGKGNTAPTKPNTTTAPSTEMTMPDVTIDTNIPDPEVESNSTMDTAETKPEENGKIRKMG